jgi:hypothetical protein
MTWWRVVTIYAVAAIETNPDGVVVWSAPIYRKHVLGKPLTEALRRVGALSHEQLEPIQQAEGLVPSAHSRDDQGHHPSSGVLQGLVPPV